MHERFNIYPGDSADEHVYMAGSAVVEKRLAGLNVDRDARVAAWDELPKGRSPSSITALRLFDHDVRKKKLPKLLKKLTHLKYLSVPAHLVPDLTADAIPPTVCVLVIETIGPATMPARLVLPHVKRLMAPGPLLFGKDTFPALEHLSLHFDRKQKMLPVIARLHMLRSLGIGPVSDPAIFEALADLPALEYLAIGGNLESLDGIARLGKLTNLTLSVMRKLADVSALGKLERVAELSLLYCPHLDKLDVLLHMKSLRRLEFLGCADKSGAIEAIRTKIEALGLDELSIS